MGIKEDCLLRPMKDLIEINSNLTHINSFALPTSTHFQSESI